MIKSFAVFLVSGLCWSTTCFAEAQRYLAIQHTDTVYANQGVCAYHFSLDSGGADEFGHLYITLQFNDKKGKAPGYPHECSLISHRGKSSQ